MFGVISIITASVLAVLGFVLGPLSCKILNRIPAEWLCDYDETPSEEILSGKRYKIKPTGIVMGAVLAAALLATVLVLGVSVELAPIFFLYIFLILIAAADAKYTIIPDQFTIAVGIISLIFAVIDFMTVKNFITSWYDPLLGGVCGFAVLMILDLFSTLVFKKTGFGFGDVKLMGALGIMFGYKYILVLLVVSSLVAAFHFLILIFAGKAKKGIYLPMGPYICIAVALTLMLQSKVESVFNMYKIILEMDALP